MIPAIAGARPGKEAGERKKIMFASIARLLDSWKRYSAAVQELSHLSDRELADIGISRSDIERIAWEHAHN